MKLILISIAITLLSFIQCYGQTVEITGNNKIEVLKKQREDIITQEKAELRKEVERINEQLDNDEISLQEADELKEKAAQKHALNIENRLAILDNKIALLERNKGSKVEADKTFIFSWNKDDEQENPDYEDKRTSSTIMVAAGFNNALQDGQSLDDSDFKIGGSRFFEIGWVWKTRVFENSNWLRFKYGVSFQFNGLKPTDNRVLVDNDGVSELQKFEYDLDKSKFRMDNLVIPLHFEFGPSKRIENDNGHTFSTYKKFKLGLGGYTGFNIGERQKLKFDEDGDKTKEKLKSNYNTNDFIYGLSAYIGWGNTSLYAKYDLNPIFDDPTPDLNNMSLGVRFDLD